MAKTTTIDIANVQTDPDNAREHDEANMAAIQKSLDRFGPGRSIVLDGTDTVRAGNGTVEAARAAGIKKLVVVEPEPDTLVAVRRPEWSEQEAAGYAIADNRAAELAKWDVPQLQSVIDSIPDIDLGDIGFAQDQLDELIKGASDSLGGTGDVVDDEVPDPPTEPVTKPGDVWTLGRHILVCGDCTDERNYKGRFPLCLTDPPYGLGGSKASGKNDYESFVDTKENVAALAKKWVPLARSHCDAVVFSPGVTRQWLYPEPDWVLCWFYGAGQLRSSWGFNCWQPFLCYGRDPSLANGRGARPDAVNMNTPANAGDIGHPCPKPMKLWAWLFERLGFSDGEILDPFAGSGTTLIVAEQLNRTCYGIEIEPRYCDVIVERWQNLTGGKAKRETS